MTVDSKNAVSSGASAKVKKTFLLKPTFLLGVPLVLATTYLCLMLPERPGVTLRSAGKHPFRWNQDAFWSELEKEFNQARDRGCESVATQIGSIVSVVRPLIEKLSTQPVQASDPIFADLESNLFRLAPLSAACPSHLPEYVNLITRVRTETKQQSKRWDMNAPETRERLYRLLYGTRLAMEEALLQAPGLEVVRSIVVSNTPSATPATELLGIKLHSGDILLSRGGAPTSALIARGNDFPGCFSHVALLYVDQQTGEAFMIESHIEKGVAVGSIKDYLADKKLRIVVLRLCADLPQMVADPMLPHKAASFALSQARAHHIPYDFAMDYKDHAAQFCSEVASAAYEPTGLKLWKGTSFISSPTIANWLASLGVKHFETQEPADLEYDPQLAFVAEWRDPETLFKAHVDDAVTDALVEEASPEKPLPYNVWFLPVTRLAKAYSYALNRLGKAGPIPEGMSATAALRVDRFRKEHAYRAQRVIEMSAQFKKQKGYTPPFWELTKMAHEVK